ncbi:MAG: hypothetical protein KatS3mg085_578 [Candidatus Dojkabacteria bacterium]|nr:MAG: hypothetical protein KatS3mg085_578 [Candidatus Dojkabacteria bacterium]
MLKCNASVTILNKFSKNIKKITQNADIVVTATGQTQLLDHTFFKKNAIVIDVTSKKVNDKVYGDVIVNKKIENKISYITPVPGGIGPITIACLLRNLTRSLGYEQN